jgi:hypothetical protein
MEQQPQLPGYGHRRRLEELDRESAQAAGEIEGAQLTRTEALDLADEMKAGGLRHLSRTKPAVPTVPQGDELRKVRPAPLPRSGDPEWE